jgi:hypothetical protein
VNRRLALGLEDRERSLRPGARRTIGKQRRNGFEAASALLDARLCGADKIGSRMDCERDRGSDRDHPCYSGTSPSDHCRKRTDSAHGRTPEIRRLGISPMREEGAFLL